jgi:hypothetical protein
MITYFPSFDTDVTRYGRAEMTLSVSPGFLIEQLAVEIKQTVRIAKPLPRSRGS